MCIHFFVHSGAFVYLTGATENIYTANHTHFCEKESLSKGLTIYASFPLHMPLMLHSKEKLTVSECDLILVDGVTSL